MNAAREQYKHAHRLWRSVWRTFLTDRREGPFTAREAFLRERWADLPWSLSRAASQYGIDWLQLTNAPHRLRMKRDGHRISFR
ncbi:MAG TPA: hypothetical protein VJM50_23745 [Pyrinomonadaceae bacterium]|nr:hypothetical protein [Pyrinomonadaceae bacterium]